MTSVKTKERPILFNAPMIRAIIAGTKTQTRRVVKWDREANPGYWPHMVNGSPMLIVDCNPNNNRPLYCPYGKPGERLWVRETFYVDDYRYPDAPAPEMLEAIEYRASHDCTDWEAGCPCTHGDWRPSIHMPRWASRITLEITDVRVEPVQSISGEDALAEGCMNGFGDPEIARSGFCLLWDSINGGRPGCSWADNPWCWAISFRRIADA